MIRLLYTKLSHIKHGILPYTLNHGYYYATSSRKVKSDHSHSEFQHSLAIDFLQKSCGLSLESATSTSKKLQLETTENPDSVLNFLRTLGLTQSHIKSLITKRPALLLADLDYTLKPNLEFFASLGFSSADVVKLLSKDPGLLESDARTVVKFFRENGFSEKQVTTLTMKRPMLFKFNANINFKPKLEFFKSLGFSELQVARLLSAEPYILERSLENKIIPCIEVLRRVLGNDEDAVKTIMASYRIIEFNLEKVLEPNISLLISHGVPKSLVLKMFIMKPTSLLLSADRLSEIIGEVKKLGFIPTTFGFMLAVRSMVLMSNKLWEKKLEVYRSFGMSREKVYFAFKLQPMCMLTSQEKIRKLMSFFLNKLNLKPSTISRNPNILLLSLEKRIIPRCSVLQILVSKGLIKRDFKLIYMLRMTEKMFVENLVSKHKDVAPELIEAHQGRIEFQGFPEDLKM